MNFAVFSYAVIFELIISKVLHNSSEYNNNNCGINSLL